MIESWGPRLFITQAGFLKKTNSRDKIIHFDATNHKLHCEPGAEGEVG